MLNFGEILGQKVNTSLHGVKNGVKEKRNCEDKKQRERERKVW